MEKIGTVISRGIRLIEQSSNGNTQGVPTGIKKFDELTGGGLQPSELMVIASRPAMGKTSLAISLARNIAVESNEAVGFVSLEMSGEKLVNHFTAQETGYVVTKLRSGQLERHEWEVLNVKKKVLENAPIFIDSSTRLAVSDLVKKCENMVEEYHVKSIFIDYLQLIDAIPSKHNFGNREQEISMIIRVLKQTARELDVSIVVLSQLSRAVEGRIGAKRPMLPDLRDSGAIEDHADIVCFIYRPEYYKIDEWDDDERAPCAGQAELIVAKHRSGGLENIRLSFNDQTGKFSEFVEYESPFSFENNPFDNEVSGASMNDAFGTSTKEDDDNVPF